MDEQEEERLLRDVALQNARSILEARQRAEAALRESELRYRRAATEAAQAAEANAKFRAFFEQETNFAGVLALDGTVVEANRLFVQGCGFSREEVIGRPFWECGWWSPVPTLMADIRAACQRAAEGHIVRRATPYFGASGSARAIDLTLAPVKDAAGLNLFVAATGVDVTDRQAMEEAMREADRKKDDFIALLAHELRNPLAPIRTGLDVLRRIPGESSAGAEAREMMERQLGHMVRLIDDLLDVSRISRNKMELRRERIELRAALNSAVEAARPAIEAARHHLIVSLPPEPVHLDADLTRLAQVFSNLLTNSAKYTEAGGRIWLTAIRQRDEVIVAVRDTGIGIPRSALTQIFDMFSQVDRSIERATGGLGIGLALVKGLVEMHGGSVTASSDGSGRGCTFMVRLPVLPLTEATPTVAPSEEEKVGPGLRILVVDDNRDARRALELLLRLEGNEVQTATDGEEGVAAAAQFQPDVILMDMGMPRLNGLEATRRIRSETSGQGPIILALTGWGQEGDRTKSQEAGCDGHLVKPVNLVELARLLRDQQASRGRESPGL